MSDTETAKLNVSTSIQLLQLNAILITGFIILFSFSDKLNLSLFQVLFDTLLGCIIIVLSFNCLSHAKIVFGDNIAFSTDLALRIRKFHRSISIIVYVLIIILGVIIISDATTEFVFSNISNSTQNT